MQSTGAQAGTTTTNGFIVSLPDSSVESITENMLGSQTQDAEYWDPGWGSTGNDADPDDKSGNKKAQRAGCCTPYH